MKPRAQSHIVDALPQPPHDVLISCLARLDHFVRESPSDERVHRLHHLSVRGQHLGQAQLEIFQGEILGSHQSRQICGTKSGFQLFPLTGRKAVGECVSVRNVDSNRGGIPFVDKFLQQQPLALAVDLAVLRIRVAMNRVEAAVRAAAQRQPLDPFLLAAIEKHVNGAPARRERCG